MGTSSLSPFRWQEDPRQSIFAGDPHFAALKSGKSFSQTGSESVARRTRETGRNPGTIPALRRPKVGKKP